MRTVKRGSRYTGKRYCVIQYAYDGSFVAVLSGMGKHKGRSDSDHSYSRACAHARSLRETFPGCRFKVEEIT